MKAALETLLMNIANLFKIKSIVTLTFTAGMFLLLYGKFDPPQEVLALYCTSYGAIITYFFTKDAVEKRVTTQVVTTTVADTKTISDDDLGDEDI